MINQKAITTIETKTVGDKQVEALARSLKKTSDNIGSIKSNLTGVRNIFFSVFGAIGVRQITGSIDSISLLRDRIFAFAREGEDATQILKNLYDAAQDTNTSTTALAQTYSRISLATSELGLSSNALIGLTQTLQNTFRLSGASIAEAGSAAIQLSQGLASGQLRGQELRSVLESNVVIGGLLAKQLGVTRGQLLKFAATGKLTSDVVIKALAENSKELNDQSKKLSTTFEQSLVKGINALQIKLLSLNDTFLLQQRFSKVLEVGIKNIDLVFNALAVSTIPLLISAIKTLATVSKAFVVSNPVAFAFSAITIAVLGTIDALDQYEKRLKNPTVENEIEKLEKLIAVAKRARDEAQQTIAERKGSTFLGTATQQKILDRQLQTIPVLEEKLAKLKKQLASKPEEKSVLDKFIEESKKVKAVNTDNKNEFQKLNDLYYSGGISIKKYYEEFKKLQFEKQFDKGRISAIDYQLQLDKVVETNNSFTEKVFTSLSKGAIKYSTELGTYTSNLNNLFINTFNNLENAIFDSLKSGKLNFADFTQAILDDLLRIIIRMEIVNRLAEALGYSSGGANNQTGNTATPAAPAKLAKGGVFSGGKQTAFATGGIVNGPTFFPSRTGMNLMGEKGPEAIVPLKRTSSGDLGIQATPSKTIVNINNNANAQIEVEENNLNGTKVLEVTVNKVVRNAITNGQFDKALGSSFGIKRQGSR